jgi:hypothetical protein
MAPGRAAAAGSIPSSQNHVFVEAAKFGLSHTALLSYADHGRIAGRGGLEALRIRGDCQQIADNGPPDARQSRLDVSGC